VSRSRDTALIFLDSPGAPGIQVEAKQAAPIADAVLWVFDSSAGGKNELAQLWEYAAERSLPGLIFISGLDKEGTAWAALVEEIETEARQVVKPDGLPFLLANTTSMPPWSWRRRAWDATGSKRGAPRPLC